MGEDYTLVDFENTLYLKNQLINIDIEKLYEIYQNYEAYLAFLNTVVVLVNTDSAFLFLHDSFFEKIVEIIQIHRFSKKDPEINSLINDIIEYINHAKTISDSYKNLLKNGYLSYQEDIRKLSVDSENTLFYVLSYDAIVYVALKSGEMDRIQDDDVFSSSMHYLLESVPEFFQNQDIQKRVLSKFEEISKKNPFFRRKTISYAKGAKKVFLKTITKEE